ncbi:MAG: UDP-N-acetylmuramate dehydrogenase [Myxococcales bacterium]
MRLRAQVPLASCTTLRLGGPATRLLDLTDESEIPQAFAPQEPICILGGGSNVVVADQGFDGTVIRLDLRGILPTRSEHRVEIEASAGEPWDSLVARTVDEGWSGLECLSGIPGLVGATPIQNVGAYGYEVSERIRSVRVYDRDARSFRHIDAAACGFAYRSSMFRQNPRFVVVSVRFALQVANDAPVRYAELAQTLHVPNGQRASLGAIRQAVLELRRSKGMIVSHDDPDSVSVGSFFVNVIQTVDDLQELERRASPERVPRFAFGDLWKVPAAWLIERAGFHKGYGEGPVGVSRKHTLALVHRGGGHTADLLALARSIRNGVKNRWGVDLVAEPVFVGCQL